MTQDTARAAFRKRLYADEGELVRALIAETGLSTEQRAAISTRAAQLVTDVRRGSKLGLMESFLSEYGLDSAEGVALM